MKANNKKNIVKELVCYKNNPKESFGYTHIHFYQLQPQRKKEETNGTITKKNNRSKSNIVFLQGQDFSNINIHSLRSTTTTIVLEVAVTETLPL